MCNGNTIGITTIGEKNVGGSLVISDIENIDEFESRLEKYRLPTILPAFAPTKLINLWLSYRQSRRCVYLAARFLCLEYLKAADQRVRRHTAYRPLRQRYLIVAKFGNRGDLRVLQSIAVCFQSSKRLVFLDHTLCSWSSYYSTSLPLSTKCCVIFVGEPKQLSHERAEIFISD